MERRSQGRDVPQRGSVIGDHFATFLGTYRRPIWPTIFLQLVVPALAGLAVWHFEVRLRGAPELIAGVSVLAALLFGLVIYVFQLGVDVRGREKGKVPPRLPSLIDQLFQNVLYAVLVAIALLVVFIVAAQFEGPTAKGASSSLPVGWSVGIVVISAHLLAVISQCVKRTRRAYLELASAA